MLGVCHRVLMSSPFILLVPTKTWCIQVNLTQIFVSLSMGFTSVKKTVCHSRLEFCPPAINPEFVMECKLIAHPI